MGCFWRTAPPYRTATAQYAKNGFVQGATHGHNGKTRRRELHGPSLYTKKNCVHSERELQNINNLPVNFVAFRASAPYSQADDCQALLFLRQESTSLKWLGERPNEGIT